MVEGRRHRVNIIDLRAFTVNGEPFVAYVTPDDDASTSDADCYSPDDIAAFRRGDWSFVGLIVRDSAGREASVWSVHYGVSAEWSVGLDTLMVDDYYIPALVREIQEEAK
jgi:hypothetical protein